MKILKSDAKNVDRTIALSAVGGVILAIYIVGLMFQSAGGDGGFLLFSPAVLLIIPLIAVIALIIFLAIQMAIGDALSRKTAAFMLLGLVLLLTLGVKAIGYRESHAQKYCDGQLYSPQEFSHTHCYGE